MRQIFVNTVGLVCKLDLAVCLLLREKCQKGAAPAEQMMADVSWRYIKRISAGMYIVRMPFYLLYRLSHLGNTRIPLFLLCIAPTIQPCLNRFAVMERKLPSIRWLLRLLPPLKLFTLLTAHCFHCLRCFHSLNCFRWFHCLHCFYCLLCLLYTAYTAYIAYTASTAFTA